VDTKPKDAVGLYRAGLTLYIDRVRELAPWKEALGRQIGFEDVGSPGLFAARRGGGTRWHFDKLENFTVQLQGTKRWRVAPNRQVALPMENWVTRQAVTDPMRVYVPDALPRDTPPEKIETVELRPGSMLYLPRGHWHTAEASSRDSFTVTFLFGSNTWVQRFAPALTDLLTADPEWRDHAMELSGDTRDDGRARAKAAALLARLREMVGELRPEDLVPEECPAPRVGPRLKLRRNPLAFLSVGAAGDEGTRTVTIDLRSLRRDRFEIEIEPELAPLCLFVAGRRGSFLASEAAASTRRVPFTRAARLLRLLLDAGVVQQD
jgi:50S ribosomal protein L16 3-hydroxylase